MVTLPIYEIEAFGDSRPFCGNPAAVIPLAEWLDTSLLQAIAAANNLAETAFVVQEAAGWRIRWFTPTVEVPLCGHATLASGFVLMTILGQGDDIRFDSHSGPLGVRHGEGLLTLDFPARPTVAQDWPAGLAAALGVSPVETYLSDENWLAVVDSVDSLLRLAPDFKATAAACAGRGIIVTAAGGPDGADFSSRYFAPAHGIDEDPVTGSAHSTLTPFWADRLGKSRLVARQLSARGGFLTVEAQGKRVAIAGRCRLYLEGQITI